MAKKQPDGVSEIREPTIIVADADKGPRARRRSTTDWTDDPGAGKHTVMTNRRSTVGGQNQETDQTDVRQPIRQTSISRTNGRQLAAQKDSTREGRSKRRSRGK